MKCWDVLNFYNHKKGMVRVRVESEITRWLEHLKELRLTLTHAPILRMVHGGAKWMPFLESFDN